MKIRLLVGSMLALGLIIFTNQALAQSEPPAPGMVSLFDGKTLDGWIQEPINATNLSGGDIADWVSFAKKLTDKSDPVSAFLNSQLDDALKADLAAFNPTGANVKTVKSAAIKGINKIISESAIYDKARFQNVRLRSETEELLKKNPQGRDLIRLNRTLLEDAFPAEMSPSPPVAWIVKDGAMASTGAGRGVIYTKNDYVKYRLIFSVRQVKGNHQPCALIFGTRPEEGKKSLDALGAIQFQPPNGGHWDYRPGKNKGGEGFSSPTKTKFTYGEWSRVEMLVDAGKGTARMAVAQPIGTKAVENLDYNMPDAGKKGPIAWQMHNAGIFDEFKDVWIEVDPKVDDLITTK